LYPVAPVIIPPPGKVTWARAFTANREPIMDMSVDNVDGSILASVTEMQGVCEFTLVTLRHKIYRDNSKL
jgi:hypothetical protein